MAKSKNHKRSEQGDERQGRGSGASPVFCNKLLAQAGSVNVSFK